MVVNFNKVSLPTSIKLKCVSKSNSLIFSRTFSHNIAKFFSELFKLAASLIFDLYGIFIDFKIYFK